MGQSEWGSCNFMHSRGEIRCFIQSCADYWLRVFHADGLRMDAVSRLIYWQGDPNRGVNGSTLEFLKGMNAGLQQRHPRPSDRRGLYELPEGHGPRRVRRPGL